MSSPPRVAGKNSQKRSTASTTGAPDFEDLHTTTIMGSTPDPTPTAPTPAHGGTAPAGALTTVFTPPASCADSPSLFYRTSSCMPLPERWSLYWDAASYYSPGICPSGMANVAIPPPSFGPPVEPGETAIVCCPTGYTLSTSSSEHWCYGSATVSDVIAITTAKTSDESLTIATDVSSSYFTTSSLNSIYPIQVRWRESDLSILETDPLTPGAVPTEGSPSAGGVGGGSDGQSGGQLSNGAIAGIVVAAIVVGLMVAGLGLSFFLLRHSRKRQPQRQQQQNPQNENGFQGRFVGHTYLTEQGPVEPPPPPGKIYHHPVS